ncbi:MAG: DUF1036 domain-containing protein [Pseudomonadota bacterium]
MTLLKLAAACLSLLMTATGAVAQFKICNDTDLRQSVAIAYKDGDAWVSEGWWAIDPNECKNAAGGDLKNRYYYYRATVPGGTFVGEDYWFCTQSEPFTIRGEKDCEARGYRREVFSEVDTGQAKSFTLTLIAADSQRDPEPEPEPKQEEVARPTQPSSPQPGSLGEPFTVTAVFQGCDRIDGNLSCRFYANGWRWFAYDGGGSVLDRLNYLDGLSPGTLLTVSGDVLNYGDISAEVAVYTAAERRSETEVDNTTLGIQGKWRHSDGRTMWEIVGAEIYEYYDGEGVTESFFYIADQCDAAGGRPGPFLVRVIPEAYQDPDCYFLLGWDAEFLQLAYAGSVNGQTDDFWKVWD